MPWGPKDAKKHTKKASTPKKKRQWAHVADSMLESGKSEGAAIRAANAVVKGIPSVSQSRVSNPKKEDKKSRPKTRRSTVKEKK